MHITFKMCLFDNKFSSLVASVSYLPTFEISFELHTIANFEHKIRQFSLIALQTCFAQFQFILIFIVSFFLIANNE